MANYDFIACAHSDNFDVDLMFDVESIKGAIDILHNSWTPWIVVIPGLIAGVVGGAIPGLSGVMVLALLLPVTIHMDLFTALMFMTAMFTGAGFGSSIPSILMGLPGSSSSVAAAFDGFPMTKDGRHNEALGLSLMASVVAMIGSYILLLLVIGFLASAVLKLGPLENLMIILWGLTMIASVSGDSVRKGLIAGILGILLGTVGTSLLGYYRGTMGFEMLQPGIPQIPALMGLLACSGLFDIMNQKFIVEDEEERAVSFKRIVSGMKQAFTYPVVLIRGSVIGVGIGALPGVGAAISNLISYAETKRLDKDPDSFGKGNPKGVVAADSANSSAEGGSLGTLLALGIPGGGGTAVLLSAFTLHGIMVGPRFVAENTDLVYALIFANIIQGLLLIVVGLLLLRMILVMVKVPIPYLVPAVFVLAVYGAYITTSDISGPLTLIFCSILGWFMTKYNYPVAATVVGLLLGGMAEDSLIQVSQLTAGFRWQFIADRPIAMVLFALIIIAVTYSPIKRFWKNRRIRKSA